MVNYSENDNALQMGDDDVLAIGDHELGYDSTEDEWVAEQQVPTGGPNGNHGEINGAIEYSSDSQKGENSIEGDGSKAFVELEEYGSLPLGSSARSVAFWVKIDSTREHTFFEYGNFGTTGEWFQIQSGNKNTDGIDVQYWSNNVSTGDNVLTQGTWYHITVTYDGTGVHSGTTIYVDGSSEPIATTAGSDDPANTTVGVTPRLIGRSDNTNYTDGNLDDVRVYDRELTSSEATDLSNGIDVTNGLVHQYNFEYPETPDVAIDATGDPFPRKNVPRSAGGSAVPRGLANAVSAGEVLADNGQIYNSVQTAVDNSSGWVFVGPGTFSENVTISTAGLTIEGTGYGTYIDGGSGHAIRVSESDVTVRNLRVSTTAGGGNSFRPIYGDSAAVSMTVENVTIVESDDAGIFAAGTDTIIKGCRGGNVDGNLIRIEAARCIVTDCIADSNVSVNFIYQNSGTDDSIIANNVSDGVQNIGIRTDGNDTIIIGNRVLNSGNEGVATQGTDGIIANNRISDSTNADINDGGTNTELDANLTGASN